MKRILRYFLILSFLSTTYIFGQDSFDDKRHDNHGRTSKTVQPKPFNLQPLKRGVKTTPIVTENKNFQIPSIFNRLQPDVKFKHTSIKRQTGSSSIFIKSTITEEAKQSMSRTSNESTARSYLSEIGPLLQIKDASNEFQLITENTDAIGQSHLKMQQVYKGVKVHGAEVIVHMNASKNEFSVNGKPSATPTTSVVTPKISFNNAITSIETDLDIKLPSSTISKNGFIIIPKPVGEVIFYPIDKELVLAYHITVHADIKDRWEYFIDAQTGAVLHKYYHTCTLVHELNTIEHSENTLVLPPSSGSGQDLNGVTRQLNTFNTNGNNYMIDVSKPMYNASQSTMPDNPVGGIMTLDLQNQIRDENTVIYHVQSASSTWNYPVAISAHYNASVAYDYFLNTFNRNSINGAGGTVFSFINVVDDDGGGLDNAFWNGTSMFYGNGRDIFSPLAGSLDVGGHEMSHGVIQNTAGLVYEYQSGAINESFADIFGTMIDRDDWKLGEDIVNTQYFSSGAMRDLSNPNNGGNELGDIGWQPKDMTEYYTGSGDNGGVHINSGIPNRAYYLIATAIGKDKSEQIYYRTLDTYLTANSQFIDLRLGVIQAATDLHGVDSQEVQEVINAFEAVGILDGDATDTDNDIPTVTGSEFILSVDIRDEDPNTLYISDTNGENYVPLTTTKLSRKPSVADDGSLAIYVTEDFTINAVSLDENNIEEFVISDEPIWGAVSLSKDGNRLAAVRNDVEGVIFISDLLTSESMAFELYNPTSADGVTTGEVLYADALEWDYSGQYLIYDALNELNNANGSSIDYWDVGSLRVWNNQTNSFGDGNIQKIFTNLPEGVSIGNPSFAKTSGNILAFDLFDETDDSYEVITANIETGIVQTVYVNNKLGFPNFSTNDNQLLFDTYNDGDEDIAIIGLASDKMSPQGAPSVIVPNGIWGIWYTVGERETASSEKDITDFRFNVTNPASVGSINGTAISVSIPSNINPQSLVATFTHSQKSQVYIGDELQQSGVNTNDFSNPINYTVIGEDGSSKVYTVTLNGSTTTDPNDDDGDGVANDIDQCPNTISGTVVDFTGCPVFSLPSNNFSILAKGESCASSNNGSISINAQQNLSYSASLNGSGVTKNQTFSSSTTFTSLQGGTYQLCITVQGQNGYERCYDIVVEQPQELSVSGKVDTTSKSLTLQMQGSERYFITVNNEFFTTEEQEIELQLQSNINTISVTTAQDCQGVYEDVIDLSAKTIIYPNPVRTGKITVQLSAPSKQVMHIQLNTFDGRTILMKTVEPGTTMVVLDADMLQNGIYLLSTSNELKTETFKIIKQ